jgi:ABC-type multidrug transport system fused ATPase/permease subunit
VVAHRLSTVNRCKKIAVIKNGRVIEEGKYSELMDDTNSHFYGIAQGLSRGD